MLKALGADADLVAENASDRPEVVSELRVQVVQVATDGDRHQVLASADRGRDNFAFGDADTVDAGHAHLRRYYGFVPDYAAVNVADMLATPQDAATTVRAYHDLGFDALIFHPCVAGLDQVDRLADAVL